VWHRDPKIDRLKALERQELDAATEESFRGAFRKRGIPEWLGDRLARLGHLAHRVKGLATLIGALGALISASTAIYHRMRGTEVGRAEMPATGQPTIGQDFVQKPPPKP
jgi:hypothetical protein